MRAIILLLILVAASVRGQTTIIDNSQAEFAALWNLAADEGPEAWEGSYRVAARDGLGDRVATYHLSGVTGIYDIAEWHPVLPDLQSSVPHVIMSASGTVTRAVNQRVNGGRWNALGRYVAAGELAVSIVFNYNRPYRVVADAIRFVAIEVPTPTNALPWISLAWDNPPGGTSVGAMWHWGAVDGVWEHGRYLPGTHGVLSDPTLTPAPVTYLAAQGVGPDGSTSTGWSRTLEWGLRPVMPPTNVIGSASIGIVREVP